MCKSECRASLGGAHLDLRTRLRTWLRTVGTVRTKVRSVSNHKALYFTGFGAGRVRTCGPNCSPCRYRYCGGLRTAYGYCIGRTLKLSKLRELLKVRCIATNASVVLLS